MLIFRRTGEKTSSLYGFQIYARKWHKDWTKEEVTSLNYMLPKSPRFPSVVPKDPKLNPLKDIIICFDLGTEIKSTIPGMSVSLITDTHTLAPPPLLRFKWRFLFFLSNFMHLRQDHDSRFILSYVETDNIAKNKILIGLIKWITETFFVKKLNNQMVQSMLWRHQNPIIFLVLHGK